MPYNPAADTAVSREAVWFTTEPAFTGCPALLKTSGGPFDIVQGYPRRSSRRARELLIWRDAFSENIIAFGQREWRHEMVATIMWPVESHTGMVETDLQTLDTAIAAVYARIRGPQGDKTHGGVFLGVGAGSGGSEAVRGRYVVDPIRAEGSRAPLEYEIRYLALDSFAG